MRASSQIDAEADAVRRTLAGDLRAGSAALAQFSSRYARRPEHKNAALAMKASVSSMDDPAILDSLRRRMTGILGEIVADSAHADAGVDAEERAHARKRLFARFRREPLKQETVCRTDALEMRFERSGFVLGPISFELRSGEITALVGENAHGKTTLIRMLVGELSPHSGEVAFPALSEGKRFRWAAVKQHIGYLPQKLLDWHGSLADMLYFQASLRGLSPLESETQIQYLLARLDLAEHLAKRWSELSGGFQLRFALAQVLVGRPRLLVLDEPLANLDPKAQAALLWDIRYLARSVHSPMAVLISSQVLNPLEAISDNVVFLRRGQVVFQGPTGAIGADRKVNLYECDTSLSLSLLQQRIGDRVQDISHNGVYYIIRTPLSVSYPDMLRILNDANVEFTH
ncbi:MAG TPA: ABC transporter ATP-binding protein, partial [Polyangia bacterium]|nr:ABC transporter ATP-binding protein [Polyangia bacterium]